MKDKDDSYTAIIEKSSRGIGIIFAVWNDCGGEIKLTGFSHKSGYYRVELSVHSNIDGINITSFVTPREDWLKMVEGGAKDYFKAHVGKWEIDYANSTLGKELEDLHALRGLPRQRIVNVLSNIYFTVDGNGFQKENKDLIFLSIEEKISKNKMWRCGATMVYGEINHMGRVLRITENPNLYVRYVKGDWE